MVIYLSKDQLFCCSDPLEKLHFEPLKSFENHHT